MGVMRNPPFLSFPIFFVPIPSLHMQSSNLLLKITIGWDFVHFLILGG